MPLHPLMFEIHAATVELQSPASVCESPSATVMACLTVVTDASTSIEDGLQIEVTGRDMTTDGKRKNE